MSYTISLDTGEFRPDALLFEHFQNQKFIRRSEKYNQRKQRALLNLVDYVMRFDLTEKQRGLRVLCESKGLFGETSC